MDVIRLDFKPSKKTLESIRDRLSLEDGLNHSLFYNWEITKKSITNGCFASITLSRKPIGYLTWKDYTDNNGLIKIVEIQHAWLEAPYRRKGYGKKSLSMLLSELTREGYDIAIGQCASPEGEALCNTLGFQHYQIEWSGDNEKRYLPLNSFRKESHEQSEEMLEFLPEFNEEQKHIFSLDGDLQKYPIITDIPSEWEVRIISKGRIAKEGIAKYILPKVNCKLGLDRFVIIDKPII